MERGRRSCSSQLLPTNGFPDGPFDRWNEMERIATIPVSSSPSLSPSSSSPSAAVAYIEHRVTMKDTLAGVAIKYGVEVADIRRLNGLATDLQMFAHKSLRIPLPGRHPPSSLVADDDSVKNGEQAPYRPRNDILDSLQSLRLNPPRHKVSPSTSLLQGCYGLMPPKSEPILESTDTTVNGTGKYLFWDDESLFRESPKSNPLPDQHPKSTSRDNGFAPENGEIAEDRTSADNSDVERSIRRRQKSDASRPRTGARGDKNRSQQNLVSAGGSSLAEGLISVRKSCSTPDLHDSDGSPIRSTSKWSLRPDSFALPIFDRLPMPASWRNKAARD